jgi:hypothetical protein
LIRVAPTVLRTCDPRQLRSKPQTEY